MSNKTISFFPLVIHCTEWSEAGVLLNNQITIWLFNSWKRKTKVGFEGGVNSPCSRTAILGCKDWWSSENLPAFLPYLVKWLWSNSLLALMSWRGPSRRSGKKMYRSRTWSFQHQHSCPRNKTRLSFQSDAACVVTHWRNTIHETAQKEEPTSCVLNVAQKVISGTNAMRTQRNV